MKTSEHKLKNGLRVIITKVPGAEMVSTNVFIKVGSRNEKPSLYGISHFLEHIAFKGTESFPTPREFSAAIESVGGAQNAWTSEDHTMYWNMVPRKYLPLALKSLSEQVSRLVLDEKEIDKERGTVIEEIKRKDDDPFQLIGSKLNKILWPNHPLECDILGEIKNIRSVTKKDIIKYLNNHYSPNNMVISVAGNLDQKKTLQQIDLQFRSMKKAKATATKKFYVKQNKSQVALYPKKLGQGHLILAYHTFGTNNKDRYALDVLMAILAGGMSSLLFIEIREKRGLAYAIEGGVHYFEDCGYVYIYGGFNKEKIADALSAIIKICNRSKAEIFDDATINKAKEYLKGTILMRQDGIRSISTVLGQKKLLSPNEMDYHKTIKMIESVTAQEVQKVARKVFVSDKENLLILGPYKNKEKFVKILAQK